MFTPHHSMRSASPQRKRMAMVPQAQLGNEEAASVGPQKLFADLKQSSASKKASSSKSLPFSKGQTSPSRAFAVKNSQSPLRRQRDEDTGSGSSVPVKPTRAAPLQTSADGKQKQKQKEASVEQQAKPRTVTTARTSQLVSPSKASLRVDAIFAGSVSPSKKKKSAKRDQEASPSKKSKAPVLLPSPQKTPQAARASSSALKTPEADPFANANALVTPASNIGNAGLERMRMGEMMDALHEQAIQGDVGVEEAKDAEAEAMTEEELYPEIEYMPPRVQVPHELPPALDGLPRAAEMGEMLANLHFGGTYKPMSRASIEGERQAVLNSLPDKIELLPEPTDPALSELVDDDPWPDIEVALIKDEGDKLTTTWPAPRLAPARPLMTMTQAANAERRYVKNTSQMVRPEPSQAAPNRLPVSTRITGKVAASTSAKPTSTIATKGSKPAPPKSDTLGASMPRKALLTDKSNTHRMAPVSRAPNKTEAKSTKKMMNPALTDFENDAMGKSVRAKLAALEAEQPDVTGFAL